MDYANDFLFQGVIVNKFETPSVTIINLSTGKTYSKKGPVVNYPKITFLGEAAKEAAAFEKGQHVTITAYAKKRKLIKEKDISFPQSFYGETIEEAPKVLAALGLNEGRLYEDPINKGVLAGEVMEVSSPSKNMVKLVLRTFKNNRRCDVTGFYYTRNVPQFIDEIRARDGVACYATVQTQKKLRKITIPSVVENSGETGTDSDGTEEAENVKAVYYENIIISDIKKVG